MSNLPANGCIALTMCDNKEDAVYPGKETSSHTHDCKETVGGKSIH